MATLLRIIQDAALEIALEPPASAFNATDLIGRQLGQHVNRTGEELAGRYDWPNLKRLYTFPTVQGKEEYDLPSDFGRLVDRTAYDVGDNRLMNGSLTSQEWWAIKNSFLGSGIVHRRFRIVAPANGGLTNTLRLDPIPQTAGINLVFEYVSKWWVARGGARADERCTLDTDEPLLNAGLLTMGASWRHQAANGLATTNFREFWDAADRVYSQEKAAGVLDMTRSRFTVRLLDHDNVPETGMGQP